MLNDIRSMMLERGYPLLQTIEVASKTLGLGQNYLRAKCQRGEIPALMVGNRWKINIPAYWEMLDAESKADK